MKKEKLRAYCPRCRHEQIFLRAKTNHPLHLILALLTAGLWLISWIALYIGRIIRPWRCEHCGWHKPDLGHQPRPARPSMPPRVTHPLRPPAPLIASQTSQLRP
jgi:predicted RNA-binding Zn-ribbon protein involved in translation (DUF1610 family)